MLAANARIISFNPRARRGRDCKGIDRIARISCFNPRARRGRDALR